MPPLPAFALAAALLSALSAAPAAAVGRPSVEEVDVALVLAVDVSGSMTIEDLRLQRDGYVAALRSPDVHRAILNGATGRIGLTYFEWGSMGVTYPTMPWRVIDSAAAAVAFADELARQPLNRGFKTSISTGIDHSLFLLDAAPFRALRKVVDISGDGPNNSGRPVLDARAEALARNVVINGLPIQIKAPGRYDIPDIDLYYQNCVIGGAGSFIVRARSREEFVQAVRAKIVLEIANLTPPPEPRVQRASAARTNCFAGEDLYFRQPRN